jgi:hypothetical protein
MDQAELRERGALIAQCKQKREDAMKNGATGDEGDFVIYAGTIILRKDIEKKKSFIDK